MPPYRGLMQNHVLWAWILIHSWKSPKLFVKKSEVFIHAPGPLFIAIVDI